jgi:hypothetical protein
MSLGLLWVVTSLFDQSDWLKLLGIAGAMVALYLVAKRLGGGEESYPPPTGTTSSTQIPTSQAEPAEPQESPDDPQEDDSDEPDDVQPIAAGEEVQPRNIQITDWNFAKFEVEVGPPNRDSFVGELMVNLLDKSTGQAWQQTYLVATPAGLEKALRKSKLDFEFLPQTLVMNRYDVKQLRKAVLGDIGRIEAARGDVPPDASDAAAAGES